MDHYLSLEQAVNPRVQITIPENGRLHARHSFNQNASAGNAFKSPGKTSPNTPDGRG
jgi:hypothetical protein